MRDEKKDPKRAAEFKLAKIQRIIRKGEGREPGTEGMMSDPKKSQGRILAMLTMQPEISQRKLTFLLGTSRQSMAEMLSKLEEKGYVKRTTSEEDKRKVDVSITEEGKKAIEEKKGKRPEPKIPFDDFSDEDIASLNAYLDKILVSLKKKYNIEDAR